MTHMSLHASGGNDRAARWFALSMCLVVALALGLHFGTRIRLLPNVRDEYLMKAPIDAILRDGWSVRTAIDYQEVKGPVFFWMYAVPGEALGDSINAMRAVSLAWFVLGAWPLILMARLAGVPPRAWPVVALLYGLSPYNAFVAQLLMSEPSFNLLALWMMWAALRGLTGPGGVRSDHVAAEQERPDWLALTVFTLTLAMLLHHRPHAAALAGAAALTAFERKRFAAWPWMLACLVAGLSRLPLYLRWGGMVTSDYQGLFGFGIRVDGLTYLLAAVLPWTGAFLIAAVVSPRSRRRWRVVALAATAGLTLGFVAAPDLSAKVVYTLPSGEVKQQAEYAGVVTTGLRALTPEGVARTAALALLTAAGAASVAAMLILPVCGLREENRSSPDCPPDPAGGEVVIRLAFWTLACGLPLYVITAGPVYDRYLVVWAVLMPIVWWRLLPWPVLTAQMILHSAMLVSLANDWLMGPREGVTGA